MGRLSKDKNLINIENKMELLQRYFRDNSKILAVYLFGSYDTPYQSPLSDVDFAVLLFKGCGDDLQTWLELQTSFSEITQQEDVNVVILNRVPVILQFKIISTGSIIYEADSYKVNEFHQHIFKIYGDYVQDYYRFCAEYDQSLRKDYIDGK